MNSNVEIIGFIILFIGMGLLVCWRFLLYKTKHKAKKAAESFADGAEAVRRRFIELDLTELFDEMAEEAELEYGHPFYHGDH